jgi:hypothetical protein
VTERDLAPVLAVEEVGADEILVTSDALPGPAGLATVALLEGAAELSVDGAEPDGVVSVMAAVSSDARTGLVMANVLDPGLAVDLDRWLAQPSPRTGRPLSAPADGTGVARRAIRGLGLLSRLAVGLDELARADLSEATRALSLVDLGVSAVDLAELGPLPDGTALVAAGLDRWEELDPDAWEDEADDLLAATIDRSSRWSKSLQRDRPDVAGRLRVLTERMREDRSDGTVVMHSIVPAALDHPSAAAPMAPMAAPAAEGGLDLAVSRSRSARAGAGGTARPPAVEIAFAPDLAGRLIAAERVGHHLTVHLGGVDVDDAWLRVFEAGPVPRLLALAPVGSPERTWRTAVALIGPDVVDSDLLADVTRRAREPFRSPAVRRTERATHLGKVAARSSRTAALGSSGRDVDLDPTDAWRSCAEAWELGGDAVRAGRALRYAADPPGPTWSVSAPLMSDLA